MSAYVLGENGVNPFLKKITLNLINLSFEKNKANHTFSHGAICPITSQDPETCSCPYIIFIDHVIFTGSLHLTLPQIKALFHLMLSLFILKILV